MIKTITRTVLALIIAGLSTATFAGHHEKAESAADAAKKKMEMMQTDADEAMIKQKIDEAQQELDMEEKLKEEAEAAETTEDGSPE